MVKMYEREAVTLFEYDFINAISFYLWGVLGTSVPCANA